MFFQFIPRMEVDNVTVQCLSVGQLPFLLLLFATPSRLLSQEMSHILFPSCCSQLSSSASSLPLCGSVLLRSLIPAVAITLPFPLEIDGANLKLKQWTIPLIFCNDIKAMPTCVKTGNSFQYHCW